VTEVRLVDLEVIKRFSLAVRRDMVPADELLEVLDASRATVLAAMGRAAPTDGPAVRAGRARTAKGASKAPGVKATGQPAPSAKQAKPRTPTAPRPRAGGDRSK